MTFPFERETPRARLRPASLGLVVVAVAGQRLQETQRRLPRCRRVQDAQMRAAEDGVELSLAGEVDRLLGAGEEGAAREIMWVAVAVLGRHRRQHAVLNRQVDE